MGSGTRILVQRYFIVNPDSKIGEVADAIGKSYEAVRKSMERMNIRRYADSETYIMSVLEAQVKSFPESKWWTGQVYMRPSEIIEATGLSQFSVLSALRRLVDRGKVKVYPSVRKRDLNYGPAWLPQVSWEDLRMYVGSKLS